MLIFILPIDLIATIPLTLPSSGRLRCACARFRHLTFNTRAALLEIFNETPDVDNMSTEALEAAAKRFFSDSSPIMDTSLERTILHTGLMRHSLRTNNVPLWPAVGIDDLEVLYNVEFEGQPPPPKENFVLHMLRARSPLIHTKRGRDAILTLVEAWSASTDAHPDFFRAIAERVRNRRVIVGESGLVSV